MSERIVFENLYNTRDLGGTPVRDGRVIKRGRLIRSGQLYFASENDIRRLQNMLSAVVDFRTAAERAEKPDPEIPGVEYFATPVFDSLTAGVSRDARSDEAVFEFVAREPENAKSYMMKTYLGFVTNDYSIDCFSRFLKRLLTERDGALLWHCTAGKDRAGTASVIVSEALGVSREDIIKDFLFTNECLTKEVEGLYDMVRGKFGDAFPRYERSLHYLFTAQREYLDALYEKVDELYGSFDSFIRDALGVTDEERRELIGIYTE